MNPSTLMTLDNIQRDIQALKDNDIDTPGFGTDEYTLRTRMINTVIRSWANAATDPWVELRNADGTVRAPKELKNPTDRPEMSDPTFIVYMVTAKLFQLARNNTGYTVNFNDAQAAMSGMQKSNQTKIIKALNLRPLGDRIGGVGIWGE